MYLVWDVPEDSSSFYNAFQIGVTEFSQYTATEPIQDLRCIVATEVEDNEEVYEDLMPPGLSLAETAQRIRQGHHHVGPLEISAMAGALDYFINLLDEDENITSYGDPEVASQTVWMKKIGDFYKGMMRIEIGFCFDVLMVGISYDSVTF